MMEDRSGSLLELLIRINHDVAGALDLRTVLQRLILAAMQHVGGERASIVVVDDLGRPVDATIVLGSRVHEHTTQQLRDTLERGLAGWVMRHRKPALIPDTSMDQRWLRRPDDATGKSGPKSAVCVPLIARGQTVGALTIVHSLPGSFGSEHLELAQAIADQASIAVLNARLYGERARQARIMTALVEGAASFGSTLDLQETWERVLSQTIRTLQVETAVIGLLKEPEGQVVFRAAAGQNAQTAIGQTAPRGTGLLGEVFRKGRVVIATAKDPKYAESPPLAGINVQALLIAPIQAVEKDIGVILAINSISGSFDGDAAALLQGIGALAGATIRNALLYEGLQRAKQRYLELFEESSDLVFVTDWDGKINEANRQAAKVSGLSQTQLRAMGMGQLHEIDWNQLGRGFAVLRSQGPVRYESSLQIADGRTVPVQVHVAAIEFAATDSILWTLHDQTERKQLDDLRENLAAMIYHDLRSPLSNLVSSLDLLKGMANGDADVRSTLEIAEHSAARMNHLVNSLLDINRLESGSSLTSQAANAPGELVNAAVRDISSLAEARRHAIRTATAAALPVIWVDGDMIRRVLVNLLENAIKFSRGDTEVEIGAQSDGTSVEFWVQDQGPGIPVSEHARVFEKFTRIATAAESARGLGLGLAFCKLAVEAHGGTIRIQSQQGSGARFIVTLPMKAPGV